MDPYFHSIITPAPRDAWHALVAQDDQALVFQQPEWTDGLTALHEYEDASRLYKTCDGRLLLLPLMRHRLVSPSLSSLASMPDGWGMGGVLSDRPFTPEDAAHILADLGRLPEITVSLRANPLQADVWARAAISGYSVQQRETHVLDLSSSFDCVWQSRFPSATRTKIRKAEKEGVEIVTGAGGELLDAFYDIYLQWLDRRARERHMPRFLARWSGKRREPLEKFQSAARALGPAFQVWLAKVDGLPAAAAILLLGGRQAVYWRSASVRERIGPTRANDLLQCRMIEAACAAGCRCYHMGESGGVDTLKHFKSRFGAESRVYPRFYRERLPIHRARGLIDALTRQIEQQIVKEKDIA